MIPILYEHGETAFATNGICRLPDCVKCYVTEIINGVYECEFQYPITGRHYSDITEGRIIYTTHDDSRIPQPFDIYKHTIPIDGVVTFYARHISYRLNFVIVEPYDAGSCTLAFARISSKSINDNPFTFTTTVERTADFELSYPVSVRSLIGGIDKSLINTFGGEIEWDKFTVKHSARRGRETSIELRYGKNVTDILYDFDKGNDYTAVVPYWRSNDGSLIAMLPDKIVAKEGAGSEKTVALDVSRNYDSIPVDEDLIAEAHKALITSPDVNIKVSFFELWNTEEYEQLSQLQRAYLGDTVRVLYTQFGIADNQRVVKTVYDSLLDRYDSMELGQVKQSFGSELRSRIEETIVEFAPSKSAMQAAIDHATQLISGGLGGNVIISTNADGKPNEILVMDTDNKETAVNVMRININGIGFSHTGYNGPFVSAWTLDSHFVADFITTGNLNAALLTAGVIMGANGHNWFDLENDQVHFGVDTFTLVDAEGKTTSIYEQALNGLTQSDVFNKLTKNGALKGIFMQNGQLYTNMSYLRTGILEVKDSKEQTTFYVNGDTGEVKIVAKEFSLVGGETIDDVAQSIVDDALSTYNPISNLTQQNVFDKLTNGGQVQGIFLENGKIYLNFSYAQGGTLNLGGANNGNGTLSIRNSDGKEIGIIDNKGPKFCTTTGWENENIRIDENQLRGYVKNTLYTFIDLCSNKDSGIWMHLESGSRAKGIELAAYNGTILFDCGTGKVEFASKVEMDSTLVVKTYVEATDHFYTPGYMQCNELNCKVITMPNPPWTASSDKRLKKNIRDAKSQIKNINKLHVHSFEWKASGRTVRAGLVAQELQEVYPELVIRNTDGYLAIDYINMVPYLIKTIQEQQEEISNLKQEIAEIKAMLKEGFNGNN